MQQMYFASVESLLDRRLSDLEKRVLGSGEGGLGDTRIVGAADGASCRSSSLSSRSLQLHQDLALLEGKIQGYLGFRTLHQCLLPVMDMIEHECTVSAANGEPSIAAKRELVLTATPAIADAMARLEEVAALEPALSAPFLEELPSYAARVAQLEHAQQAYLGRLADRCRQREALLQCFDDFTESMNNKFVRWDALLSSWEAKAAAGL
eukprot:g3531.t1